MSAVPNKALHLTSGAANRTPLAGERQCWAHVRSGPATSWSEETATDSAPRWACGSEWVSGAELPSRRLPCRSPAYDFGATRVSRPLLQEGQGPRHPVPSAAGALFREHACWPYRLAAHHQARCERLPERGVLTAPPRHCGWLRPTDRLHRGRPP